MSKTKSAYYVDPKEFLRVIIEYKKECKLAKKEKRERPKIPDYLGKCLMLIAENLSHKPNFSGYTYRDEMVEDALENCIMYFDNFDPTRKTKNPFAYFTQISYYAFIRRITKEKKQQYTKYKIAQQSGIIDELNDSEDGSDDGDNRPIELYENISEFIGKFEEERDKKSKKLIKKGKLEEFME
jgi:hypothetical protein